MTARNVIHNGFDSDEIQGYRVDPKRSVKADHCVLAPGLDAIDVGFPRNEKLIMNRRLASRSVGPASSIFAEAVKNIAFGKIPKAPFPIAPPTRFAMSL